MSEMIERVARAINLAGARGNQVEADRFWADTQAVRFEQARAAIKAMRDLPAEPGPRYAAGEYSRRNQESMVDDALAVP